MVLDYDLQELGKRVRVLEDQVEFLMRHLGATYIPKPEIDDPRIVAAIQKGNLVEAIKIYRQLYSATLPEAKRAVEEIQFRLGY